MISGKHVIDGINLDASPMHFKSIAHARDHYLELAEGWKPYNPKPVVKMHAGVRVVRDDLIVGTKTRGGDLYMSRIPEKTVVYTQMRMGLAGIAVIDCARHHNKRVVLFMPASHKISEHQACCIAQGAKPIFKRCAAQNNLSVWAAEWCKKHRAAFAPLGLKHPLVTAALVHTAVGIKPPEECYIPISTGVLARALQIAWPKTKFTCIAVSRNLQAGELGSAKVITEPLAFHAFEKEENLPPYPSVLAYDAKVWKYAKAYADKHPDKDVLIWNVGTDPVLHDRSIIDRTKSWREWGE